MSGTYVAFMVTIDYYESDSATYEYKTMKCLTWLNTQTITNAAVDIF